MAESTEQNGAAGEEVRFHIGGQAPGVDSTRRKSNWWTAAAYNITAIVGLGVLGLPQAMAFLSWGGLAVMALTWIITYFTLKQLAELHEVDPGKRYETYQDLGDRAFGGNWGQRIVLPMQMVVEVSMDVLFTIAVGQAMIRILGNCQVHIFVWFVAFGAIQVGLSCKLPDYHAIRWIAVVAAVMSICYSTFAWISLVSHGFKLRGDANYGEPESLPPGNVGYHSNQTALKGADHVFQAFNAIGVIAFAFAAHNVVLDIQTELPSPSEEEMMKGVKFTYLVVALCYFPMAIAVYGVYGGKEVSSNVLDFMVDKVPRGWVIITNLMLIIHLIGSYQIFAVPVFKVLEDKTEYNRYVVRIVHVVSTTLLAMVFPIFSPLLGFFGGFAIAPTTYILPSVLWLFIDRKLRKSRTFTRAHYINWALVIIGTIIMFLAILGGIGNLIKQLRIYDFYDTYKKDWNSSGFYPSSYCDSES